jgi:hypothetical protein
LLADLACAQDNVEEQYADFDSKEETKDLQIHLLLKKVINI